MSERRGHVATLQPGGAPEGNRYAERHGFYAQRVAKLDEEGQAIVDRLMSEPHAVELDVLGAVEIAKLTRLIDRIDDTLASGPLERGSAAKARALLDVRGRLTTKLLAWCDRYALTPSQRLELASRFQSPGESIVERVRQKMAAVEATATEGR